MEKGMRERGRERWGWGVVQRSEREVRVVQRSEREVRVVQRSEREVRVVQRSLRQVQSLNGLSRGLSWSVHCAIKRSDYSNGESVASE